jgi:hypothetical protein
MKRHRLVCVLDHLEAIDVEHTNKVPAKPVGRHGVEEPGVFIPLTDSSEFPALLPDRGDPGNGVREGTARFLPQLALRT